LKNIDYLGDGLKKLTELRVIHLNF